MRLPPCAVLAALLPLAAASQTPAADRPLTGQVSGQPTGQPTGQEELQRALVLLDEPDYAGAQQALERALVAPGNDRSTLVAVYEQLGIIKASLRDSPGALDAFQHLVVLDPDFKPSRDYSPRVNGPYLEARAWLADNAPLRFAPLPPTPERGVVRQVGAAVLSDPLKLARAIRFHLRDPRNQWVAEQVPLGRNTATVKLKVTGTGWWAELLGEHDAVLSRIGSAAAPILEGDLSPKVARGPSVARWSAVGLGAGALAAAAVGAWFGAQSQAGRDQLASVGRDAEGRITSLRQPVAFAIDRQVRSDALVADVLFATSAALAASGAGLWFFGDRLLVTPAGVKGKLP